MSNSDMLEKLIENENKKDIIEENKLYNNESFIRVLGSEYNYLLNISNPTKKYIDRLNKVKKIVDIINEYF